MQRDAMPVDKVRDQGRKQSLRIAVVTETYPPEINGVAMTIAHFVDGMRQRNHRMQLIRPRQSFNEQPASGTAFEEVLVPGMSVPRYPELKMGLPAKGRLVKLWTRRRPDLVHIVTEGPLGWSALQAAQRLGLPVCSDFRTNFHAYSQHYGLGWMKGAILAYLRWFHNSTIYTMVPSGSLRSFLATLQFRNLRVVSRGVDTRLFDPARRSAELRASWGAGPDDPVVLHVGRLAAEKNLPALSRAFEYIRARVPRARLVVVGDGPARRALQASWPDAVFAGIRTGEDLAAHYASGDLFLFPSLTETYGNVTLEAMASGLALVAYNYAAAADLVRHGQNGILAPYGDTHEFARMAAELAAQPLQYRAIGAQARRRAAALDWDRVVEQLESLFLAAAAKERSLKSSGAAATAPELIH